MTTTSHAVDLEPYRKAVASSIVEAVLAATDLSDTADALERPIASQRAGAAADTDAPTGRTGRTRRPAAAEVA